MKQSLFIQDFSCIFWLQSSKSVRHNLFHWNSSKD